MHMREIGGGEREYALLTKTASGVRETGLGMWVSKHTYVRQVEEFRNTQLKEKGSGETRAYIPMLFCTSSFTRRSMYCLSSFCSLATSSYTFQRGEETK